MMKKGLVSVFEGVRVLVFNRGEAFKGEEVIGYDMCTTHYQSDKFTKNQLQYHIDNNLAYLIENVDASPKDEHLVLCVREHQMLKVLSHEDKSGDFRKIMLGMQSTLWSEKRKNTNHQKVLWNAGKVDEKASMAVILERMGLGAACVLVGAGAGVLAGGIVAKTVFGVMAGKAAGAKLVVLSGALGGGKVGKSYHKRFFNDACTLRDEEKREKRRKAVSKEIHPAAYARVK